MKRRAFVTALGAAAFAETRKGIVGGHPWVYAATRPGNDITEILDTIFSDMRYAGLDTIELMHTALFPADAVERIGSLTRKHSLPVLGSSYGANFWKREDHNKIAEETHFLAERLKQLGGRTLGVSVGNAGRPKTAAELDAQAEALRKAMAVTAKNGVVLNLHNHVYEVANQEHDLRGTLERIPDAKLGPDLNWLIRAGVNPVEFLKRHAGRVVFLHLRDQRADGKWAEAMGEGSTDYAAIARTLREIRFDGDPVIELAHERGFQPTRPLRESLRMSREYVRRVMGF